MTEEQPGERAPRFEDRYELGRRIGSGGTSEVFEALDRRRGCRVAVKLLTAEAAAEPGARDRFACEVRYTRDLSHPNVLSVLDHGEHEGRPFLVTELVEGRPLTALMRERRTLAAGQVFGLFEQLTRALEAVHERGLVHRDVKPDNVLVGTADDLPVRLTDFGVAKAVSPGRGPATAQGVILGTPAYMAPETVAGQSVGPAADLYALAVILYELVVGEHPFPVASTPEMLRAHLLCEPRIPWSLHPDLRRLLERGLAKTPSARFTSATEFRRALRGIEREILSGAGVVPSRSGPVKMPAPSRPSGTVRAARQARRMVVAIGVACATLITALVVALPVLRWASP